MNRILCVLPMCLYPSNRMSNKGTERINQYINGLNKFFEYIEFLKKFDVDVYIFDNSIDKNEKLPQELLDIIPDGVTILNDNVNNYGSKNKGAGLVESWIYLENIIAKYDFLIHFEPRQLLQNFNFIQYFLENQENLFTIGKNLLAYGNNMNHFNTGLFCVRCSTLIDYINNLDINVMINNSISIEYDIYNFFKNNKIPYNVRDKMELVWFDNATNCEYKM